LVFSKISLTFASSTVSNNSINNLIVKIMAYVISDDCISCGTCAGECPVEAISEGAEHYVIDADACTECGTCASVCPSEAISLP
jgi:ferredoxin